MHLTLPRQAVSKALLPILLHEVRGATQLLVGLRAILDIPGGDDMFEKRCGDLANTSQRLDELGFALAVLSTATGANMLMARREPRSARILWDLAVRAARAQGAAIPRGPVESDGAPPLIAPGALDGWQVAWVAAALAVLSLQVEGGFRWSWASGGQLSGAAITSEGSIRSETLDPLREKVPGSAIELAPGGGVTWTLPQAWLLDD